MTRNLAYSDNLLYVCGTWERAGNSDIIWASFDETLNIQWAYRYGSSVSSTETMGDCVLTSDNRYLVGVMNTKATNKIGTIDLGMTVPGFQPF